MRNVAQTGDPPLRVTALSWRMENRESDSLVLLGFSLHFLRRRVPLLRSGLDCGGRGHDTNHFVFLVS